MPNYVRWSLTLEQVNPAGVAKFQEIMGRLRTDDRHQWLGAIFADGQEGSPSYEETKQYDWTTKHLGPKWAYVDDLDEMSCRGDAAWHPPDLGIMRILEEIETVDPQAIAVFAYQDEMPNFYGAAVYQGTELIDSFEDDYDDLIAIAMAEVETLKGKYDFETGHWEDEESEMAFQEVLWEVLGESQWDFTHRLVEGIKSDRM